MVADDEGNGEARPLSHGARARGRISPGKKNRLRAADEVREITRGISDNKCCTACRAILYAAQIDSLRRSNNLSGRHLFDRSLLREHLFDYDRPRSRHVAATKGGENKEDERERGEGEKSKVLR